MTEMNQSRKRSHKLIDNPLQMSDIFNLDQPKKKQKVWMDSDDEESYNEENEEYIESDEDQDQDQDQDSDIECENESSSSSDLEILNDLEQYRHNNHNNSNNNYYESMSRSIIKHEPDISPQPPVLSNLFLSQHQHLSANSNVNMHRATAQEIEDRKKKDEEMEEMKKTMMAMQEELNKMRQETQKYKQQAQETEKKVKQIDEEHEKLKKHIDDDLVIIWKWKENDGTWKPYDKETNDKIESLKINEKYQFFFKGNNQTYEVERVSKDKCQQVNIKTNIWRDGQRIQRKANEVEYPEWWDKNALDVNYGEVELYQISMDSSVGKDIISSFNQTLSHKEIIDIQSVQNQMLYDSYWGAKQKLIKLIGAENLNERTLFHGTKHEDVMGKIQKEGFRKEFTTVAKYGEGTYFARDASYSFNYSAQDNNGNFKMFVSKVLCGEMEAGQGRYKLRSWPKKNKGNGLIYDSLVNDPNNPSIFVIHDDVRAYPMFVITYQDRPQQQQNNSHNTQNPATIPTSMLQQAPAPQIVNIQPINPLNTVNLTQNNNNNQNQNQNQGQNNNNQYQMNNMNMNNYGSFQSQPQQNNNNNNYTTNGNYSMSTGYPSNTNTYNSYPNNNNNYTQPQQYNNNNNSNNVNNNNNGNNGQQTQNQSSNYNNLVSTAVSNVINQIYPVNNNNNNNYIPPSTQQNLNQNNQYYNNNNNPNINNNNNYNYNGMYPVQPIPVQPPQINQQQQQSSSYPSYPQPIQQPIIYGAGFIYP